MKTGKRAQKFLWAKNLLSNGEKYIGAAKVILRNYECGGGVLIECVKVPEGNRKKGIATEAIKQLIEASKATGIELGVAICPDDKSLTDPIERTLAKLGFTSLVENGCRYRLDKSYKPRKRRIKQCSLPMKDLK